MQSINKEVSSLEEGLSMNRVKSRTTANGEE